MFGNYDIFERLEERSGNRELLEMVEMRAYSGYQKGKVPV